MVGSAGGRAGRLSGARPHGLRLRSRPAAGGAAATVSRCLRFHAEHGSRLDVFRVALLASPPSGAAWTSDGAFGRDVIGLVAAAVRRGAREGGDGFRPWLPGWGWVVWVWREAAAVEGKLEL